MEKTTGDLLREHFDALTPSLHQPRTSETFDHIQLTPDEEREALRLGRAKKDAELKRIAYMEKVRAQKHYPTYTFEDLFFLFGQQYTIDQTNEGTVRQLCKYFAGDKDFNGDLTKGLFLVGGVGVGKTSIMHFFRNNQVFSFRIEPCRDVETNYAAIGDEYLTKVSKNLPIAVNVNPFGHKEIGYCFDDLGTEANGKHYGKEKNVMADVLLNRYDNKLLLDDNGNQIFTHTHMTTNLTADNIKEMYGTRVTDRIREMFNIIKFPVNAKSRRK